VGTLAPEDVVEAAVAMIDENGIAYFSMRKLAAALDVNPMTIYLRFDSKADLLEAVVESVVGEVTVPSDGSWEDRTAALALGVYEQLLRCRGILPLLESNRALAATMLRATESGLALMEEAGYRGADAVDAFRSLVWHSLSWAMAHDSIVARIGEAIDAGDSTTPTLDRLLPDFSPIDPDALFRRTTSALVRGLVAQSEDHQSPMLVGERK
jgi:AcrR family transcriptional regulator